MDAVADSIERSITVEAPIERVWPLVSVAGWWIGDGDTAGQKRYAEGGFEVVEDPEYGTFRLRREGSEPLRYVAFRWYPADGAGEGAEGPGATLVEFWLSELAGGETVVRVVESGFARLPGTDEDRRRSVEDNTSGWRQQMDILKTRAEHVGI
jgi:uncharacterized protein YndB with AHSA1/START domain